MYSTKLFSCSRDESRHVSGTRKDKRYFSEISTMIRFEYGITNIVIFILYESVKKKKARHVEDSFSPGAWEAKASSPMSFRIDCST